MIQTIGLEKRFGSNQVLDNINIELSANKIYGLLGRNGVGKTTLLSILSNHLRATSGEVLFDGESLYENEQAVEQIAMVRERGIGRDIRLDKLYKTAAMLFRNWDQAYADYLIEKFALNRKMNYSKVSRGEQTLVGLILGLASRCRYTFFDEPSLGLDAANRDDFYKELLADYERHPRTFVISTHLIDEGANLFEDIIILKQRQVLLSDSVSNILASSCQLSGWAQDLAPLLEGKEVLEREYFGQREIVTLRGDLTDAEKRHIDQLGIEMTPVSLQKLFVLLTK